MKMLHNGFAIEIDPDSLSTVKIYGKLKELYKRIPKTKCLQCPGKEGVEADCCKTFSPPMLLIEFVHMLRFINKKSDEEKQKLYLKCFESFLDHKYIKPCILLDENNLCSVYEARPFSCRMFGIYDDEEWNERLKQVSVDIGMEREKVPFNEQCKGIKIKPKQKNKSINRESSDFVFQHIHNLDIELFPKGLMQQALDVVMSSCTYLPFDAHYLLMLVGQVKLDDLAAIKITSRILKDKDPLAFARHKKQVEELLKNIKEEVIKCQK